MFSLTIQAIGIQSDQAEDNRSAEKIELALVGGFNKVRADIPNLLKLMAKTHSRRAETMWERTNEGLENCLTTFPYLKHPQLVN